MEEQHVYELEQVLQFAFLIRALFKTIDFLEPLYLDHDLISSQFKYRQELFESSNFIERVVSAWI